MNQKADFPGFDWDMPVDANSAEGSVAVDEDGMEAAGEYAPDEPVPEPDMKPARKPEVGFNRRRRRRFAMKSNVRVLPWNRAYADPDIATLLDANADGILFVSDQDYPVGARLLVRFPYPGHNSGQQDGYVVRVKALSDGRSRVAVSLKPLR